MTTLVVGSGGLLGAAVAAELARRGEPVSTLEVPWRDASASIEALAQALGPLVASSTPWRVAWCAGAGVVASAQDALDQEVAVFHEVLDRWAAAALRPSTLFLASSAGGVYAGSENPPFTETTPPRPLRPYGEAKLAMERAAAGFGARTGSAVLIGRISNLYGPGQNLDKGQGLISAMCRAYVTGEPLPVFVPLSTCRDYLYVTDAATMVAAGTLEASTRVVTHPDEVAGGALVKILAARQGSGYTIGELLDAAARLYDAPPPTQIADSEKAAGQVADLRFRSTVWPELDGLAVTPIEDGIAATMQDVRRQMAGRESGADSSPESTNGVAG